MITLIVILGIFGGLIISFLIYNKLAVDRFDKDIQLVCDAHKNINYPDLDNQTQMRIIETGDLTPIGNLIPELSEKGVPLKLLKYYIKISKSDFKEYLKSSGFIDKHKIENATNPKQDGIWIKNNQIIDQERGMTHRTWNINSDFDSIDIYVDLLWNRIDNE